MAPPEPTSCHVVQVRWTVGATLLRTVSRCDRRLTVRRFCFHRGDPRESSTPMTARTLFRLSCCGHDWTAREGFRTITSVCVRVKIPAAEREVQLSGAIGLPAFRRTVDYYYL